MSFLLNTPELFYRDIDRFRDINGNHHTVSVWRVSTAYGGSFTMTRADAALIIWERNAK